MLIEKRKLNFIIAFGVIIVITLVAIFRLNKTNPSIAYDAYEIYMNRELENSLQNNLDILVKVENWDAIDDDEKKKILYTILKIEKRYLGLNTMPKVSIVDNMESFSGYDRNEQKIYLSKDVFYGADGYLVVECIAHEMFHMYELELIDLYMKIYEDEKYKDQRNLLLFERSVVYSKEISEYENGYNDMEIYMQQELEIDAYNYSKDVTEEYRERIQKFLE